MLPPKFAPGARVCIPKLDGRQKTVVSAYVYKGAEWAYLLIDDNGTEDDGWREDELEPPT